MQATRDQHTRLHAGAGALCQMALLPWENRWGGIENLSRVRVKGNSHVVGCNMEGGEA